MRYTVGLPFFKGYKFKGYKFCKWSKKGSSWKLFSRNDIGREMTLAEKRHWLFTIHVNLHVMEFPLIFGETNFVEVPKTPQNLRPLKKSALQYFLENLSYNTKLWW